MGKSILICRQPSNVNYSFSLHFGALSLAHPSYIVIQRKAPAAQRCHAGIQNSSFAFRHRPPISRLPIILHTPRVRNQPSLNRRGSEASAHRQSSTWKMDKFSSRQREKGGWPDSARNSPDVTLASQFRGVPGTQPPAYPTLQA